MTLLGKDGRSPLGRSPLGGAPLLGRGPERALLGQLLDGLSAGRPCFVEVVGDPGIGKTRLLADLGERAQASGRLVLAGRAAEFGQEPPFGVLIDAFDDHLADLPPEFLTSLRSGLAPSVRLDLLAPVFPALRGLTPTGGGQGILGAERYQLYRGVRQLIEALAATRELVVVLDDLHWASDSTTELLAYLLRHPPRAPVLFAFAYRARQAGVRLLSALAADRHGAALECIELGPLSRRDAGLLLGPSISPARRNALYHDSGGTPCYLLALARLADNRDPGRPAGAAPDAGEFPAQVRTAFLAEFAALSPAARLVSQAAAVAGDPFQPELVAEIAQVTEDEVLRGIDEMVAHDLVRPTGVSRRFGFRHPLLRHVTYQAISPGWRLAAHHRAALALDRSDASVIARAPHVERAAHAGDEAAIETLLGAATATMPRAPATAVRWLQVVLALQDDSGQAPRRLAVLWQLALAQGTAGNLRGSRDTVHELLSVLPHEPTGPRARAVTFCARLERLLGRHAEARALLLSELARLPRDDPAEAVELQLELASGSLMRSDFEANRTWAEQALAGARRHGNRPACAAALCFLAMAAYSAQDMTQTAALLDEAAALVDAMPDSEVARRPDALLWLGWSELNIERYHAAVRHLERCLTAVRATGQAYMLTLLLVCLSDALRWLGRVYEAAACCEDAVDAALLSGSDELCTIALAAQAWIAMWNGDIALALRATEEAATVAGPLGEWIPTLAGITRALARLISGDPAGCVELIVSSAGGPGLAALDPWQRVSWYEVLVRTELAQGNTEQAAEWAGPT